MLMASALIFCSSVCYGQNIDTDVVFQSHRFRGGVNSGEWVVGGSVIFGPMQELRLLRAPGDGVVGPDSQQERFYLDGGNLGFMMYTNEDFADRFSVDSDLNVASSVGLVRFNGGSWEAFTNTAWVAFEPEDDDFVFAQVDLDSANIQVHLRVAFYLNRLEDIVDNELLFEQPGMPEDDQEIEEEAVEPSQPSEPEEEEVEQGFDEPFDVGNQNPQPDGQESDSPTDQTGNEPSDGGTGQPGDSPTSGGEESATGPS